MRRGFLRAGRGAAGEAARYKNELVAPGEL